MRREEYAVALGQVTTADGLVALVKSAEGVDVTPPKTDKESVEAAREIQKRVRSPGFEFKAPKEEAFDVNPA